MDLLRTEVSSPVSVLVQVQSKDQWHQDSLGQVLNMQIPGPYLRPPHSESVSEIQFKQTLPPQPPLTGDSEAHSHLRTITLYNDALGNYGFSKSLLLQLIFLNMG